MIILALDSGVERTGYAIFNNSNEPELLGYDCIFTSREDTLPVRLLGVRAALQSLMRQYQPDVCVMEQLFFSKNVTTGIMVAQSQGAVMSLMAEHQVPCEFIKPQEIKMSLTGYGNADKKSVQKMVMLLLDLKVPPKPDDTVDAIACGLTYCTMRSFNDR